MQFSTCEEHVQLVERAKALLARSKPGLTLGELHFQAMQLLVASLEKRKFAVTDRPRKRAASQLAPQQTNSPSGPAPALDDAGVAEPIEPVAPPREPAPPRKPAARLAPAPRQRGRYVPAAERREVFTRDEARCTFTDEQGQRCRETRYLELHHLKPFAHGGENLASNLTLRCTAHNSLAAEQDFGREVIEQKRDPTRHESLAAQSRHRHDTAS
jgi:5-methylcytosine-specific restriction endonuclease McrA